MENKYTNEKKTENTVKSKKQLNAVMITSKNVVWISTIEVLTLIEYHSCHCVLISFGFDRFSKKLENIYVIITTIVLLSFYRIFQYFCTGYLSTQITFPEFLAISFGYL